MFVGDVNIRVFDGDVSICVCKEGVNISWRCGDVNNMCLIGMSVFVC